MKKSRDISIGEYLNRLQIEYIIFELRSKIYPSSEDKDKFRQVMLHKKSKIDDIAEKNSLDSIFSSLLIKKNLTDNLFVSNFVPEDFHGKDKYYYLFIGSEFSYKGQVVKLCSYDLIKLTAIVELNEKEKVPVELNEIRRIL